MRSAGYLTNILDRLPFSLSVFLLVNAVFLLSWTDLVYIYLIDKNLVCLLEFSIINYHLFASLSMTGIVQKLL